MLIQEVQACLLMLACLDLPENSEIITPACGFSTTVAPMIQLKLKPVFCDVDLTSYQANRDLVINSITENSCNYVTKFDW